MEGVLVWVFQSRIQAKGICGRNFFQNVKQSAGWGSGRDRVTGIGYKTEWPLLDSRGLLQSLKK